MKQKYHLSAIWTFLMFVFFCPMTVSADLHVETITMSPNGNEILTMPEYWRNYFVNGHSLIGNPSWISSNSSVVRVSSSNKYTCRIHAMDTAPAGAEVDITCKFSYWEGVSMISYAIYWTVKIGDAGPVPGPDPNPDVDIYYPGEIPTDSWSNSGNYSITWYNKNSNEFTLTTNKELAGMAYLVNNGYTDFEGKTIKLGNDIDLTGKQWSPIGLSSDTSFNGIFDGQGHTIFGVFIGKQAENQMYYGFWGLTRKALIQNVVFEGDVFIDDPVVTMSDVQCYIGGIVGYLGNSTIENCFAKMPIAFANKTSKPHKKLYIGGLVGSKGDKYIKYCFREGDIDVRQNVDNSQLPIIGGLVGEGGDIEYCENISDNIYVYYPYSDHDVSNNLRIGGIVGDGRGNITCCRSILGNVEIVNKALATTFFFIGGITGSGYGTIVNSYSCIASAKFNSVSMWNNSGGTMFGGICAGIGYTGLVDATIKASFSNSDVVATSTRTLVKGYDGTTTFSSEQMKTSAFLEELNMYSILEMDGPVWAQDDGGYPYIAKLHEASGINSLVGNSTSGQGVFSLSGQRLSAPRKGVNIVGGRKVVVK